MTPAQDATALAERLDRYAADCEVDKMSGHASDLREAAKAIRATSQTPDAVREALPYSTPQELFAAFKRGEKFVLHYHGKTFNVTRMEPREHVVYVQPPSLPVKVKPDGSSAEGDGGGIWLSTPSASAQTPDAVRKALETAQMALADGLPNAKVNPALLLIEAALLSTPSASAGPQQTLEERALQYHYGSPDRYVSASAGPQAEAFYSLQEHFEHGNHGKPIWRISRVEPEKRTVVAEFGDNRLAAEAAFHDYARPQPQQADGRGAVIEDEQRRARESLLGSEGLALSTKSD